LRVLNTNFGQSQDEAARDADQRFLRQLARYGHDMEGGLGN
jgi:hypothetical protein